MNKKLIHLTFALVLTLSLAPISRAQSNGTAPAISAKTQINGSAAKVTTPGKKTTISPSHRTPGTSPGIVHPKTAISTKVKPNLHTHQALFNHKAAATTPIKTHLHTHQNMFNHKNKVNTASSAAKISSATTKKSAASTTTTSPKN
jgi:hypothetical protein